MLERYLVEHCSPTLASIKTANLFNMPYASWKELDGQEYYLISEKYEFCCLAETVYGKTAVAG